VLLVPLMVIFSFSTPDVDEFLAAGEPERDCYRLPLRLVESLGAFQQRAGAR
jgi:hypothetical protein